MDAVCLAVVAALELQGNYTTIPSKPKEDARGLLIQMIIPNEKITINAIGEMT